MMAFEPSTHITRDQLNRLIADGWKYLPTNIPSTYRPNWTMFHAIREFVQNSLDEVGEFDIQLTPSGLEISDSGRGVQIVDFLMRYVEKPPWTRGQFGEGLKIACLACLRNGYPVEVLTVNRIIRPVMVPTILNEVEVPLLYFVYREFPAKTEGTTITVRGYRGELYLDKFVQKLSAYVVHSAEGDIEGHKYMEHIIDYPPTGKKWLFVRDIFVREFDKEALFSYNLWSVELDPDRVGLKFPYQVTRGIGHLWSTCDNRSAVSKLLSAATIPEAEEKFEEFNPDASIYFPWARDDIKKTWKEVFFSIYPLNTVLFTDVEMTSEARHAGKNVVKLPVNITRALQRCQVQTDEDVVAELARARRRPISTELLSATEHKHLALAYWLQRELLNLYAERERLSEVPIIVYSELPKRGEYEYGEIRLARPIMRDEGVVVEVFVHELAHHCCHGCTDYTTEYENARDYLTYLVYRITKRPTAWELYDIFYEKEHRTPRFTPRGKRPEKPVEYRFEVGQKIRITSGPFADFVGTILQFRYEPETKETLAQIQLSEYPEHEPIWQSTKKLVPAEQKVLTYSPKLEELVKKQRFSLGGREPLFGPERGPLGIVKKGPIRKMISLEEMRKRWKRAS